MRLQPLLWPPLRLQPLWTPLRLRPLRKMPRPSRTMKVMPCIPGSVLLHSLPSFPVNSRSLHDEWQTNSVPRACPQPTGVGLVGGLLGPVIYEWGAIPELSDIPS